MMKWTKNLSPKVYERFCKGRTLFCDLKELVNCRYEAMDNNKTKEDALIDVLSILDSKGMEFYPSQETWDKLTGK